MKLNYDCIRAILIYLEEYQVYISGGILKSVYDTDLLEVNALSKYANEDIIYSVKKMYEAGLIDATEINASYCTSYGINDITYL